MQIPKASGPTIADLEVIDEMHESSSVATAKEPVTLSVGVANLIGTTEMSKHTLSAMIEL